MTQKFGEELTPLEEVIRTLEAYKKGGLNDTGGRTILDGFNQALRIVRTMSTVYYTNDHGDRLIEAFRQHAINCQTSEYFTVLRCSSCGNSHGDKVMAKVHDNGPPKYWYICEDTLNPAFHFPEK